MVRMGEEGVVFAILGPVPMPRASDIKYYQDDAGGGII